MMKERLEEEVKTQLDDLIKNNIITAIAEDIDYANWIDFNEEWGDKEVEEAIARFNNDCLDYIILKLTQKWIPPFIRWK